MDAILVYGVPIIEFSPEKSTKIPVIFVLEVKVLKITQLYSAVNAVRTKFYFTSRLL